MSAEDKAKIWHFVDPHEELAGLDADVPMSADIWTRGREVLGLLHEEKARREEQLSTRSRELARERAQVVDDLAVIRGIDLAIYRQQETTTLANVKAMHDNLWGQIKYVDKEPEFLHAMAQHPPFALYLEVSDHRNPFGFYFLDIERNRRTIEERFPHARHAVSRAFGVLTREAPPFRYNLTPDDQGHWGVVQEGITESGEVQALQIVEPKAFFSRAFEITGFSTSLAKAVLAVAYIQAETAERY